MLKKIKNYIRLKLGIAQTHHNLEQLNNRLDFLAAYVNLTVNETLHVDPVILKSALKELRESNQVEEFNTTIHKNDLMFAFHVYNHRYNLQQAVFSYFKIGIRTAQNLHAIVGKHGLQPKRILDYGSGYGRVSRFLPKVFTQAEIVVSEVKEQSMDFQKQHFGFETITHTQDSKSLTAGNFDLILALSVFTHLPQHSFQDWLDKLVQSLNPGGALIFTFNNINAVEDKVNSGFLYRKLSEDSTFSFVSDSIKDTADYGSTYVSYAMLEHMLPPGKVEHTFLKNELAPNQEALLVIKK